MIQGASSTCSPRSNYGGTELKQVSKQASRQDVAVRIGSIDKCAQGGAVMGGHLADMAVLTRLSCL